MICLIACRAILIVVIFLRHITITTSDLRHWLGSLHRTHFRPSAAVSIYMAVILLPVQFGFAATQYKITVTNGKHPGSGDGRFYTGHFWMYVLVSITTQFTAQTARAILCAKHIARYCFDDPTNQLVRLLILYWGDEMPWRMSWRILHAYVSAGVKQTHMLICSSCLENTMAMLKQHNWKTPPPPSSTHQPRNWCGRHMCRLLLGRNRTHRSSAKQCMQQHPYEIIISCCNVSLCVELYTANGNVCGRVFNLCTHLSRKRKWIMCVGGVRFICEADELDVRYSYLLKIWYTRSELLLRTEGLRLEINIFYEHSNFLDKSSEDKMIGF